MRVLGIEGTAWCASAALYDAETDSVLIESNPYEPDSGGIHPREAAEHMSEAIPEVIDRVLTAAEDEHGPDAIDAVAFSKGPGLGPCLRTVGTAARALAGTLDVPLVGVNHMVAHLEIGRHRSGFENPVCLNASGANAHLLGYHDGRYRVLGETMDAGVGNAIDKFTRHVGWSHPGGPKVEAAAAEAAAERDPDADLVDLPYVVKGMDFSFSGISSAANDASDDGVPVEEICFSLQEHVFAMLTEVSERALSLTGADELVLGGGVAQNDRLRKMLATMCAARGADFHAPEPQFLRDNAGMIAVLGAKMAAAGDTVSIADSAIDPNFRPDQVPVTWREGDASVARGRGAGEHEGDERGSDADADRRGAEATVEVVAAGSGAEGEADDPGNAAADARRVIKRRVPKRYRHPELDRALRRDRTVAEARLTSEARRAGVPTPLVCDVDVPAATLTLQHVGERDLAADLDERWTAAVGRHLARLHGAGIVHGDPTTRNVRIGGSTACESGGVSESPVAGEPAATDGDARATLIDFGLAYHSGHVEDHAMDLHVFEGSVRATATDPDPLIEAFEAGYAEVGDGGALDRLREVEGRGRYR